MPFDALSAPGRDLGLQTNSCTISVPCQCRYRRSPFTKRLSPTASPPVFGISTKHGYQLG